MLSDDDHASAIVVVARRQPSVLKDAAHWSMENVRDGGWVSMGAEGEGGIGEGDASAIAAGDGEVVEEGSEDPDGAEEFVSVCALFAEEDTELAPSPPPDRWKLAMLTVEEGKDCALLSDPLFSTIRSFPLCSMLSFPSFLSFP